MDLSSPKTRNFLIFYLKKVVLMFWEMELSGTKIKNFRRELSKLEK